jgi:formamidopyrimidine-DNA glycosylase
MPELPEVEFNRLLINSHCLNRQITQARCSQDSLVFRGLLPASVDSMLLSNVFLSTGRHGKHFWCSLNKGYIAFHLGMTGFIQVRGHDRAIYRAAPEKNQSEEWPPRFVKLELHFEDGSQLAFGDSRRLGRITFVDSLDCIVSKLGFDPIINPPTCLELFDTKRKASVKSLLLDQTFVSGIGNWMADDILFMAGIHPEAPIGSLTRFHLDRLLESIVTLSQTAVSLRVSGQAYPEHWLFHVRWKQHKTGSTFKHKGLEVRCIKVCGRTTLYSPKRQNLKKSIN